MATVFDAPPIALIEEPHFDVPNLLSDVIVVLQRIGVPPVQHKAARVLGVMGSDRLGSKLAQSEQGTRIEDLTEEAPVGLVEIMGHIKWFDVSKGFGFIVPDNGMPDVLLHVTCLRHGGFQTAHEGARVVCEVLERAKGYQCFRVISMDDSTAIHPSEMPPPRTHVNIVPTSGLERAWVKWFNRIRGFGFLTRGDDSPDIFVHMETLRRFGMTELRPGQMVLVRYGDGPKGLMAAEVRPDTGGGTSSH